MSEEHPSKNSGGSGGSGAPRKKKADQMVGTILSDRYEILSILGRGGMGVVYKARRTLIDRYVAIKVLKQGLLENEVSKKRFEQEAKASAKLNHPHLISVFDYGYTEREEPYLVMDFLEGESLEDLFQRLKVLPIDRFLKIFQQTCKALNYIHKLGVVHRDLKPSNIMLVPTDDDPDYVKLVDFGIAKIVKADEITIQRLTETGQSFGSPLYMSPEQCMGKDVDARSDIYSLGCVAFEMLTGTAPICGENALQTLFMHVNEQPLSFTQANQAVNIPVGLQEVLLKALEKNASKRFQTASEFGEAITYAIMNDTRSRQQVSKEGWTAYQRPVPAGDAGINPAPSSPPPLPAPQPTSTPPQPSASQEPYASPQPSGSPQPSSAPHEGAPVSNRNLAESKTSLPPPLPVQAQTQTQTDNKALKDRNLAESKISLPPPLPVQQEVSSARNKLQKTIPPPLPTDQKTSIPPPLPQNNDDFNVRAPEKPKGLSSNQRGTEKKDQTPPSTPTEATKTKNGGSGGSPQKLDSGSNVNLEVRSTDEMQQRASSTHHPRFEPDKTDKNSTEHEKVRPLKRDALEKDSREVVVLDFDSSKKTRNTFIVLGLLAVLVYVYFFSPLHLYDQTRDYFQGREYEDAVHAAQLLYDDGKYADAADKLEKLAERAKENFGAKSKEYMKVLSQLSFAMHRAGRSLEQVRANLDECIEIIKNEKDDTSQSEYSNLLFERGKVLEEQKKYESAIQSYLTAAQIRKNVFGDRNLKVATVQWRLGETYSKLGDYVNAEDQLGRALKFYEGEQWPNFDALASISVDLAEAASTGKNSTDINASEQRARKYIEAAQRYMKNFPDQNSALLPELNKRIIAVQANLEKLNAVQPVQGLPPGMVPGSAAVRLLQEGLKSKPIKTTATPVTGNRINKLPSNTSSPYDSWNIKTTSPPGSVMPNSQSGSSYKPYANPYTSPYKNPYGATNSSPDSGSGTIWSSKFGEFNKNSAQP